MPPEPQPTSPQGMAPSQVVREGHRALLNAMQNDAYPFEQCPAEVLAWLEDNQFIELLLHDDNEFHYAMTSEGRAAVLGTA